MKGTAPDDETLAVVYQLAILDGRSNAEVGRIVRLSRQTISGYANGNRQAALDAHARVAEAGGLARALRRFGVAPPRLTAHVADDPVDAVDLFDSFDPDVEPADVTPELIRDASKMVAEGLPPEDVLVSMGVDRREAADWLDMAEQAHDARMPGWPATGWALIDRARTHAGLRLRHQALREPAAAARIMALGKLVAPSMFAEVAATAVGYDPFAELSDAEVAALAFGAEPGDAE